MKKLLIFLIILTSCEGTTKKRENPKGIVSKTPLGGWSINTVKHDDCLFVVLYNGGIIHHPNCPNKHIK